MRVERAEHRDHAAEEQRLTRETREEEQARREKSHRQESDAPTADAPGHDDIGRFVGDPCRMSTSW